ncbi:class I SAM-dependent methyltransferase [bacterium]|nr:class I SAM-dependent methyltransferase [bacterium]
MEDLKAHWDNVWQTKSHDSTSWYQEVPATSLQFFETVKLSNTAPLIDIGSGASKLIDGWLSQGFRDITALDISANAFVQSKLRLGVDADQVTFIEANVIDWQPERCYQLWHDRAVFHFLTDPDSRERYINTLTTALAPGAFFICGGFSTSGPQKCLGLEVQRYDPGRMAEVFAPWFEVLASENETHLTPARSEQHFLWSLFQRR